MSVYQLLSYYTLLLGGYAEIIFSTIRLWPILRHALSLAGWPFFSEKKKQWLHYISFTFSNFRKYLKNNFHVTFDDKMKASSSYFFYFWINFLSSKCKSKFYLMTTPIFHIFFRRRSLTLFSPHKSWEFEKKLT